MGYLKYDKKCKNLLKLIKNVKTIDKLENVFHHQYSSSYHKLVQNVNHILTYKSFYNLIEKSMIALCTDDVDIDHYFSRINLKLTELYHHHHDDSDLINIDYMYKPPSIDKGNFYLILGVCPRWKTVDDTNTNTTTTTNAQDNNNNG